MGHRVNWVSGSHGSWVTGSLGHKMWPSSMSAGQYNGSHNNCSFGLAPPLPTFRPWIRRNFFIQISRNIADRRQNRRQKFIKMRSFRVTKDYRQTLIPVTELRTRTGAVLPACKPKITSIAMISSYLPDCSSYSICIEEATFYCAKSTSTWASRSDKLGLISDDQ